MFLIGIAGFTLASLWCGLSVDPAMLIAGRLVQGGFGALLGAVIVPERTRRVPQRRPRASAVGAGARGLLTSIGLSRRAPPSGPPPDRSSRVTRIAADLRGDLIMPRARAGAVDIDIKHGPSNSSSMLDGRHGPACAVIAPPGPGASSAAEAEALFAEAHRRRRRRRLAAGVAGLLLAGSAAAGLITAWPGDGARTHHGHSGAAAPRAPGVTLPPSRVAWVDDIGQLHIGDLATGTQQVVATVDASPADPMIVAGGRLYWAAVNQNAAPVREYDIATGRIGYLARGNSVFASADGRHLYIVQTGTSLIELPADGIGAARQLALPAGWHMSGLLGNWSVAGGIVVYSSASDASSTSLLAVWSPATGTVKIIGRGLDVIDAYTPRGARYSLLAWTPAGCLQHCPVGITNTFTLAGLTVHGPSRHGFTYGGLFTSGAFSPDGTRLAVFLNATNPQDPSREPVSELAIVNTRTGALRLVRAARFGTYEDAGWARWLPGGHRLIVGAEVGSYAVDAETLSVRAFSFGPGNDINFSTTVLPVP
jgi:hypothetical protein